MPSEKPKTEKTTSTQQPWGPSIPGLTQSIKDATGLYNSGGLSFDFYPGSTVAPRAPETEQFWAGTAKRATEGSPLVNQSKDYYSDVLSGKYLGADAPGLQSIIGQTRDAVNANYGAMGRYGSGYHDKAVTEGVAAPLFANYQNERGYQNQAATSAPQLAQQDYFDLAQLGNVGQQRQNYTQAQIDEDIARQQWTQQQQANAIALYQSLLGGQYGGTTTATGPGAPGTNPLLLGLGAATSLGGSYLSNPYAFA